MHELSDYVCTDKKWLLVRSNQQDLIELFFKIKIRKHKIISHAYKSKIRNTMCQSVIFMMHTESSLMQNFKVFKLQESR